MPFELAFWPAADASMEQLERSPGKSEVLVAVNRTLDRLESDPFDPRLGTTVFKTEEYANVSATPIRVGDWYVFWQRGVGHEVIEIVLIHQLTLGDF